MSRVELQAVKVELPLRAPFRIHHGEQRHTLSTIVAITADGITGYGEARGGNAQETYDALTALDPEQWHPAEPNGRLEDVANPGARSGLDMAVLDWRGKREGRPVWDLLGLRRPDPIETSMTVGLDELETSLDKAEELVAGGWAILKLKGGTGDDVALVRRMRERLGPEVRLRIDANTAWDVAEARRFARETADAGLEMIEQPLPAGEFDALREVRREMGPPIFLDEDIRTVADVRRVAEAEAADGVNAKLSKCGGLTAVAAMLQEARRLGLGTMLGCYVETSLGITAATHLGGLLDFADLDGNLFFAEDPFGGARASAAVIETPLGPGVAARPTEVWERLRAEAAAR